jgi:hypothetical protein
VIPLDELAQIPLQERRFEDRLVGTIGNRLPSVLRELWLRVEALHVAHAADEEDPDDVLGFRWADQLWLVNFISSQDAIAREHRAQGQAGEAHAQIGQERSSGNGMRSHHGFTH